MCTIFIASAYQNIKPSIADPAYSYVCIAIFTVTLLYTMLSVFFIAKIASRQEFQKSEENTRQTYFFLIEALEDIENKDISKKYWMFKSDLSKTENGRKKAKGMQEEIHDFFKAEAEHIKFKTHSEENTSEDDIDGYFAYFEEDTSDKVNSLKKSATHTFYQKYLDAYENYYNSKSLKDTEKRFKELDLIFNKIIRLNPNTYDGVSVRENILKIVEKNFLDFLETKNTKFSKIPRNEREKK